MNKRPNQIATLKIRSDHSKMVKSISAEIFMKEQNAL